MNSTKKTMRDVFIEGIYNRMQHDRTLFFLTADFGSPKLDKIRADYPDRFLNVGIAEQNLINVAAGLALEGFTVYAYAIAPFLIMRAYEQIRNNLSLLSHTHQVNVNLFGVGGGLSYDVSGPTHHCLEDISIMRTLPNITIFSPSDWVLAEQFIDFSIDTKTPKYMRFDGKPSVNIYDPQKKIDLKAGFIELVQGENICIVSTGFMTRTALKAIETLVEENINPGLIDVFLVKPLSADILYNCIKKYKYVVTIEEGFTNKAGLDSIIANILCAQKSDIVLEKMGFGDAYVFDIGSREYLHALYGLDEKGIAKKIIKIQNASV